MMPFYQRVFVPRNVVERGDSDVALVALSIPMP